MFSHPFVRRGGSAVKAALPLVLLAGFPVCPAHAQNTLIEAESRPQPGDAVVVNDPAASGGKAVSIPRDWQPLFSSPVPAGDRFTIWMRHKGGPLELKASMPDGQKELQWVWDQPTAWEWSKFGTYASSNLGTGVIIIRGGGGAPGPELDCVLFATDPNFDPNATPVTALAPPAAAPAAPLAGAAAPFPGTLIEAESRPQPGDAAMVDDPAASGGKAVSIPRDWQPLFSSPVPAGDHFTIWMRHKGGPLELKAALPDGQKELQWVWDQPTAWEWSKFGTYAAADLGTGVIIIRGGGGAPGPELDCVL